MIEKLKNFGEVLENVDLKKHNTFKIGGIASYLVSPDSKEKLSELVRYLNTEKIKFLVLGNGSNVILSDADFNGVIIKLSALNEIELNEEDLIVRAGAGVYMPKLASYLVDKSLKGLEWAAGLPGYVGGSVVTNAGCYGSSMFENIIEIEIMDYNGNIETKQNKEIKYAYRTTEFKENKNAIILSATFKLSNASQESLRATILDRQNRRLNEQPLDFPSAGSIFRNPVAEDVQEKLDKYNLKGPYAGHLIEECGLKGYKVGGAMISTKHANFIINNDNATSQDIYNLIKYTHDVVLKTFEIDLIVEQEFINWE